MYKINRKNIKKERNFYLTFLMAGIMFMTVFGIMTYKRLEKKNEMDSQVMGKVIDVIEKTNDEDSTLYSPIIEYEVKSVKYTCTSSVSTGIKAMIGKTYTVYYDSQNPSYSISAFEDNGIITLLIWVLIPGAFIGMGISSIIKYKKKVKGYKYLEENGILIKGLSYQMVPSSMKVNRRRIMQIEIEYKKSNGDTIILHSEGRFDNKVSDEDGEVDLLIDPNNEDNYYIDFNIDAED